MATYTIQLVGEIVRDWNSTKGGPMKSYRVALTDDQGNTINGVEWARKATSPPPEVGQKVDGTLETTDFGPKLKVTPQGNFGGGRGRSPEERASIAMQHAQKCAVEALKLAAEHGDYRPPNAGDVVSQVKTIAAALFTQVQEASA